MSSRLVGALAAPVGVLADALLGEPPARWHPVVWFGTLMERVEAHTYRDDRLHGIAHLGIGLATATLAGAAVRRVVGRGTATAIAVAACSAGRMLDREALAVARLIAGGDEAALAAARTRLAGLVGRDTSALDLHGVSRAAIESVAENSVDAVTATVWWAAVGGAPAVLAHRAVNTLDAMVGHRTTRYARFGWASARADDVVNWLPARLTALAVAGVRPHRAAEVWRVVRRDARRHPSPNGGIVEAAFAAALGVQLGGTNRYAGVIEDRGTLGDGRRPVAADIAAAVRLRRDAAAGLCLAVSAAGIAAQRASRRSR